DDPVGVGGDLGGLFGVGYAQTHAHPWRAGGPAALNEFLRGLPHARPGAGDSHRRGGVEETPARRGGHLQPFVGGGGGDDEHLVEVVCVGGSAPFARFVRGEVGGDEARSPVLGEVGSKAVHAVAEYRVVIRHHDGGCSRVE